MIHLNESFVFWMMNERSSSVDWEGEMGRKDQNEKIGGKGRLSVEIEMTREEKKTLRGKC